MTVDIDGPRTDVAPEAERLLRSLPEWFGIESAILQYAQDIARMPTFVATIDDAFVGFATLHRHFMEAAEIHVMAVDRAHHGRGIGRALVAACEDWLRTAGCAFLQVKTLSPSRPDESYARTRSFYRAVGFVALEEFPTLWDSRNPCLMLVKAIGTIQQF